MGAGSLVFHSIGLGVFTLVPVLNVIYDGGAEVYFHPEEYGLVLRGFEGWGLWLTLLFCFFAVLTDVLVCCSSRAGAVLQKTRDAVYILALSVDALTVVLFWLAVGLYTAHMHPDMSYADVTGLAYLPSWRGWSNLISHAGTLLFMIVELCAVRHVRRALWLEACMVTAVAAGFLVFDSIGYWMTGTWTYGPIEGKMPYILFPAFLLVNFVLFVLFRLLETKVCDPKCKAPARDPDDMFSITYMPAETEILLDDFGSGPAIDINGDADPDFGADDFQHKAMAELASKYNISLDSGRRCCCECERADASCEKALPLYLTVVGLVVILGFTIAFYAWRNVI